MKVRDVTVVAFRFRTVRREGRVVEGAVPHCELVAPVVERGERESKRGDPDIALAETDVTRDATVVTRDVRRGFLASAPGFSSRSEPETRSAPLVS
jgi:hypothetical protein